MVSRSPEDPRLTKVTKLCLALPEVERTVHGDHADFRVRKKVFAYFLNNHHGDGIVSVCCKSELGESMDLAGLEPKRYYLPAYIGKRGWFGLRLDHPRINWSEVENSVERSYHLVAPKKLVDLVVASKLSPDYVASRRSDDELGVQRDR